MPHRVRNAIGGVPDIGRADILVFEVDAQTQTAQLVQEHVERFGNARGGHGIAFDDGFVGLGASVHVVTLDGEDFLKDVRCAECFQRPYFHLTETLATELSFTAQRLLGDERVRTDGACLREVFSQDFCYA